MAYIQLVKGDEFVALVQRTETTTAKKSVPRGSIYDSQGRILVGNKPKLAINYTRPADVKASTMLEIAKKLTTLISVDASELKERDLKDYWVATNPDKVDSLLTAEDKKRIAKENLSTSQTYEMQLAHIPADELNYSDAEKQVIAIFTKMNSAYALSTVTLKNEGVTEQEVAKISERLGELRGVDVDSDWDREEPLGDKMKTILGTVSSEKTGLPSDKVKSLLAQGYSLNDRVGTSYLEKQYEEVLQGKRTVKEIHLDKYGDMESVENVEEGSKGKNIKLTIDLTFQDSVDNLLKSYFNSELSNGGAKYSEGVYAVALNPKTGAVLAMSGIKHNLETGELTSDSLGTVTNVFVPGSVVKAATISSGWENGVLKGNQTLTDQPIVFQGSPAINSWYTLAYGSFPITAVEALEYSSNAYMIQTALGMMGQTYQPDMTVKTDQLESAMGKLRATFGEYGLGAATGIDLPDESTGFIPQKFDLANYLTNAFGQFDNYTPMQLAQYVATIANNGVRLAPHIVEGIYDNNDKGGLGELIQAINTKEINKVNISESDMAILHQGFYQVSHGTSPLTTGRAFSDGATVSISGKTGTAESYVAGGQEANNTNAVAYAPTENPQIAVAVVFPHNTNLTKNVGPAIARDIINLYNQHHPMN